MIATGLEFFIIFIRLFIINLKKKQKIKLINNIETLNYVIWDCRNYSQKSSISLWMCYSLWINAAWAIWWLRFYITLFQNTRCLLKTMNFGAKGILYVLEPTLLISSKLNVSICFQLNSNEFDWVWWEMV